MIIWKCFAHHYHALAMNTQINKFRDLFFNQIMFLFYVWVVAFEMAWVGCDFAWGLSVAVGLHGDKNHDVYYYSC